MEYAVEAHGLHKRFGKHVAVHDVDLRVPQGSILGLLGPNGAGKTTTVRMLATLLEPDGGTARIAGFDVATQARRVRHRIGLAGQYAAVDGLLTGRQNLVLMGRLLRLGRRGAARRADQLLAQFGLENAADRPAGNYSGGMRRRLDLAACLIAEPGVVFLDEPTTGLDPTSRTLLWGAVREQAAAGTTLLLTTQYLEEADQLADEIVVIDHGRVIAEGSPEKLKKTVGGERVETRTRSTRDLERTAHIMREMDLEPLVDEKVGRVSAPVTSGVADVHRLSGGLHHAGIDVVELTLRSPSLDEVFFQLTNPKERT